MDEVGNLVTRSNRAIIAALKNIVPPSQTFHQQEQNQYLPSTGRDVPDHLPEENVPRRTSFSPPHQVAGNLRLDQENYFPGADNEQLHTQPSVHESRSPQTRIDVKAPNCINFAPNSGFTFSIKCLENCSFISVSQASFACST